MKKYFICGLLPFLILFGLSYGLIKAADVEVILGTSSGFKIVRGTSVSTGTHAFFVGSSTVSIGTTTQNAMFYVAGSSTSSNDASLRVRNSSGADTLSVRNDGAILIGTNTSTLNSALYVGSATSGSLGTITAGFLSMGTISANASLHGTTTVRFLNDIFANGTITAGTKFVGDGSSLTGITATSLGSTSNINTTGTINAGSTTVSTLTTTGSATVSNTLTAASNTFRADSGSVTVTTRVGIGTSTPSSSYRLQVTDDADLGFVVGSSGSITAKTLTVTGSATVTGALTAASNTFRADSGSVTVTTRVGIGTSTPSSAYRLQVTDDADLGFVVGSSGSITAKTITSTGSVTASTMSITGTATIATTSGRVGIGTTTPATTLHVIGTVTATGFSGDGSGLTGITTSGSAITPSSINTSGTLNAGATTVSTLTAGSTTVSTFTTTGSITAGSAGGFKVDTAGSMTATTITSTGSMTASSITVSTGTLTVASGAFKVDETGSMTAARITVSNLGTMTGGFLSVGTISANLTTHGTTTVRFLNDIFANGAVTASTLSIAGTATIATTSGANVGIGTTVPGSTLPNGFTSSTTSKILQISSGGDDGSADVGLAIRRNNNALGLDIWNDATGGESFIDDRIDSAAGKLHHRMRTAGTAVEALTILGSGLVGIGAAEKALSPTAHLHIDGTSDKVTLEIKSDVFTGTNNVLVVNSDVSGTDDVIFRITGTGTVFADGAYTGTGADYAEWFEKEGEIEAGEVVGLNLDSGKVRRYEPGEILVGVHSQSPVIVGNQPTETSNEEMAETHALIALLGQVEVDKGQIKIEGRTVYTLDRVRLGYLLANGKVLLRIK